MIDFFNLVKSSFSFLLEDYDFIITEKKYDSMHFGNWIIGFSSKLVGIRLILDRGSVLIYLGRFNESDEDWFDLCDVIRFFAPQINPIYVFPETMSHYDSLTFQVKRLSELIKIYCSPILLGDFSMEKEIINVRLIREKETIERFRKINPNFDGKA